MDHTKLMVGSENSHRTLQYTRQLSKQIQKRVARNFCGNYSPQVKTAYPTILFSKSALGFSVYCTGMRSVFMEVRGKKRNKTGQTG